MKRAKRLLIILLFLLPFIFVLAKITVMNPVWRISRMYPDAQVQLHSINSPDLYFWPTVAAIFGIPMSDQDHSIMVRIEDHSEPIDLDDLTGADEVFISRSQIVDISGYWAPSVQISGAVFFDCSFDALPEPQREVLIPYSDRFPNSFCIPYETKRQNPKDSFSSEQ